MIVRTGARNEMFQTKIESAEMFIDASGAVMLAWVGPFHFSCGFSDAADGARVTLLNGDSYTSLSKARRAADHMRRVFDREVMAHLTPEYLERNRTLYAD